MHQNRDSQHRLQQGKLRLVPKSQPGDTPLVTTLASGNRTHRMDTQVAKLLLILDIMIISLGTMVVSTWLPQAMLTFYSFNIILFLVLACTFKLLDLTDNYYILGKVTLLGCIYLLPQVLFLLLSAAPLSILAGCIFTHMGILAVITACHALVSKGLAKPNPASQYRRMELFIKYVLDKILALFGLLLTLPLFAAIAVLIWLEDRGPVLFCQARIGLDEKPFLMYKLRSMTIDAEEKIKQAASHNHKQTLFKMQHDPRTTRLGRIIRKLSVDELPQLVNVLKGEMSLVGPRPPLPSEHQHMNTEHRRKFLHKPGITGLWQITGRVNNERSFDAVAYYDNLYIENWCLMHDIWILLRTIPIVLLQKGAS